MKRRWTLEAKRKLIDDAAQFQGTRAEYLKQAGVAPSQFYRFSAEVRKASVAASTPGVIQLLGTPGIPSIELLFPTGHRLRFSGPLQEGLLNQLFRYLGTGK